MVTGQACVQACSAFFWDVHRKSERLISLNAYYPTGRDAETLRDALTFSLSWFSIPVIHS